MITWKRIEAGLYQLCDDNVPTGIHVYRQTWKKENGKLRFCGWWSGIMENGRLIGDGVFERNTLKEIKEVIAEKYKSGKY